MAPLLPASRSFYDYVPFGANPRLMGGIRRPHQKEGENIASSEKAGKVHKGITDSERQPRCDGGKTCAKAFVQAIRPRCRVMGQTCTANPGLMILN